jgi:hypothetical protein
VLLPVVAAAGVEVEHGQVLASFDAEESTNWCGYQLAGSVAKFNQVSATWTVPSIAQSNSVTTSSTWTGVGGGCTDSSCALVDPTLIQAGTEQDNNGDGTKSYYAWWEAIPAPAIEAGGPLSTRQYDVRAGDKISVSIDGSSLVVWKITIADFRSGLPHWTFTTTVPYSAAGLTAEWIEEAPLSVGTGGTGQLALSNFGRVSFSGLTANTVKPTASSAEPITLVDNDGHALCRPSAMTSTGFAVCYGSGTCN